jgi:hypothetical protein
MLMPGDTLWIEDNRGDKAEDQDASANEPESSAPMP